MIIYTVGELLDLFNCYPDGLTIYDKRENTQDTYSELENIKKILEDYKNRTLIHFEVANFGEMTLYVEVE